MIETFGWLILLCPLVGCIVISLGYKLWPGSVPGWIGTLAIAASFASSIGAGGVLVRRNPLVLLLCIELMLNSANLALVAFARAHGNEDGQVFALIVMVVAACEVAVGLGLIVALYRRRLPVDVDQLRELQG